MSDDDLAVACHVNIEFEVLNARRDRRAERFERIFGMGAGGPTMSKDARQGGREEVSVEILPH
jgi:hypothetical protein